MAAPVGRQGSKGRALYDGAYCEFADLEIGGKTDVRSELWMCGLLVRRSVSDGQRAYFTTWCSVGTSLQILVQENIPHR